MSLPLKPKISVVMPTYNAGNFIIEALTSCIEQDYSNVEIIVCDDGSTDNTEQVVKELQKKSNIEIKYFKLEHWGNPAKARNKGLKEASGEYIALLDSDDISVKNRFSEQIKIFSSHPEMDILASNAFKFEADINQNILYHKNNHTHQLSFQELLSDNIIIQSTVTIKKDVINDTGLYNTDLTFIYEDYEYYLRCLLLNKKISYFDEPLIYYRINPNGISSRLKTKNYFQKMLNTLEQLKQFSTDKEVRKLLDKNIRFYKKKSLIFKLRNKFFFKQ